MALIASSIEGEVGRLCLTRPEKRNALSHALVDEALAAMDRFSEAGVKVAVLESDSPVFCSGNDLDEVCAELERTASIRFLDALLDRPLFWIAALSGPALGAGVAVTATCPIAVASEDSWFSLPEVNIGLFPTGVLPYLESVMGVRTSFEAGLTGTRFSAYEAAEQGLISEVVSKETLDERVRALAYRLVAQPGVTDAARQAWQWRFRTPAFTNRFEQLREVPQGQTEM